MARKKQFVDSNSHGWSETSVQSPSNEDRRLVARRPDREPDKTALQLHYGNAHWELPALTKKELEALAELATYAIIQIEQEQVVAKKIESMDIEDMEELENIR